MQHYNVKRVSRRNWTKARFGRIDVIVLVAALLAGPAMTRAGEVQVYGHVSDISTFNLAAGRPRLDGSQVVELTFAVERIESKDVSEPIGKELTMYLPLEDAAIRRDVVDLRLGDPTYVTLQLGSPVTDFWFHPEPRLAPSTSLVDANGNR